MQIHKYRENRLHKEDNDDNIQVIKAEVETLSGRTKRLSSSCLHYA